MRELKFRAWDGDRMQEVLSLGINECYISTNKYCGDIDGYVIMQYTGLKDTHGKEIYDGDFLRFKHLENYAHDIQFVSMSDCCWGTEEYAFFEMMERSYIFEVVGNIYENPELLTEG